MEDSSLNNHPQMSLIETFMEITNCQSKSESLFFLESHNFDLDSAVSTFFDNNNNLEIENDDVVLNNQIQNQQVSDDDEQELQQVSPSPLHRERSPSPQRQTSQNYNLRSGGGGGGRTRGTGGKRAGITTFADLNKQEEDSEDDDSDFDPQEYYTGGEKSGMLVQDPTRRNPARGNDVNAIFDQARRSGAVGEPEENHMPSSSRNFSGTGRLLSGEVSSTPQPNEAVTRTHEIVFWRNGFTVDDGPLRRLDDPENAPFIKSVMRGECPAELAPVNKLAPVHVNLTRKEEDYQEAVRPCRPFQGVGKTLGGSTSDVTATAPTNTAPTVVPTESTTSVPTSSQGLVVDESQPSTTIQLRLADGTRLVSRFNNYHTIRDIRGFIDVSRGSATRNYQLQAMGFPPKQLVDLDQTIDQAGIANSVVIQKF